MSVLPTAAVRGRANPRHWKFASRLMQARKALGLSTVALSRAAGVGENTVTQMEAGAGRKTAARMEAGEVLSRLPRLPVLERLARALGVGPGWLAFGVAGEPSNDLGSSGLAARVRQTREAARLSLSELGRRVRSSAAAVISVEKGAMPTIDTVEDLATALGVSPAWLAFGAGSRDLVRRGVRRTEQHEGDQAEHAEHNEK